MQVLLYNFKIALAIDFEFSAQDIPIFSFFIIFVVSYDSVAIIGSPYPKYSKNLTEIEKLL